MYTVGLTGGIASGKSTVCGFFVALGVPVIDADEAARIVVKTGSSGLDDVVKAFGEDMLQDNGTLNRARLRDVIFADRNAKETLESILHPRIRDWMDEQVSSLESVHAYCIRAVPLLIETQQHRNVDRVLVVDCDEDTQLDRIVSRDQITKEAAQKILAAQVNRQTRLQHADDVIENSGSIPSIKIQVARLHSQYTELANAHG
ncbi:MAG: dephospho-CoA kinase [Pseudomonadota bacterium]